MIAIRTLNTLILYYTVADNIFRPFDDLLQTVYNYILLLPLRIVRVRLTVRCCGGGRAPLRTAPPLLYIRRTTYLHLHPMPTYMPYTPQDTWTERNRRRLPFEYKKNENPMYYILLRSSAVFGFTINLSLNGRVPVYEYTFWFIKHTYYIRIPPICFHIDFLATCEWSTGNHSN